jgi:hypothetical protein
MAQACSCDERIELRSPSGGALAVYTPQARSALLARFDTAYENAADEIGYVMATSIKAGRFELYRDLQSGEGIDVPLESSYEPQVMQALASHGETKVRVWGMGAHSAVAHGCKLSSPFGAAGIGGRARGASQ